MKERSRTEYSIMNTGMSVLVRVGTILLGYISRIVFAHVLGQDYVGVSGLFLDVFKLLSVAEIGIETSITYALYRPIAEGDRARQQALLRLYRNFYLGVAGAVLAIGLVMFLFLDGLIAGQPRVEGLHWIYLMYLTHAVASYVCAHRRIIIDAHQKMYISMAHYGIWMTVQYGLQIAVLLLTRNFYLYLAIYIICTLLYNLSLYRRAGRDYPYIREKRPMPLPAEERKGIWRNIRAMAMHKVGDAIIRNTDSLLISSLIGIVSTACYTSYYLIIGSVRQVFDQIFRGLTASIGNLGVCDAEEKLVRVFESTMFVGFWIYGFSAICLLELLGPFIAVSFGDAYLFPMAVTLVLCINYYLNGMRQATLAFRDSLGLFRYDRYRGITEAALNLVLSIVLALRMGVMGIFLGTSISQVAVSLWLEPLMLYRHRLHRPVRQYFARYAGYTAATLFCGALTHVICALLGGSGWAALAVRIPVCFLVPNILIWLCFRKTEGCRLVTEKLRRFAAAGKASHT